MDPRFTAARTTGPVSDAVSSLKRTRGKRIHQLPVVDAAGKLVGAVQLADLALADSDAPVSDLVRKTSSISDTASRSEIVEVLEEQKVTTLPVVDFHGKLIGIIRHDALVEAAASEASADMQTMVGVSKDEGALSPIPFSVRKRLPWLHVNLITAFLAAFVVAIFEGTIAQFTALAVLMPVAAGQSGNTGAQALAVTMRGLALREIRIRHWLRVLAKELGVGATNGIAVAAVTALSVWVWSRSTGLALVIALAMVISMVIASAAGALVPIGLTILKQDPAQASSIILTTITDIVGFVSFLGLATLLSGML
jgi:magnesium transporter